ncbi:hypothetical protein FXV77_11090 [Sphingobacterium phlebotomi]|uniref:Uncharacterized protein n=1 Tax=Sphingobacterium phlebotomi TaxID=2605433 RepID=A0A5D4H7M9_9SPHI|nr:hypothetical protein [Sphingobacterium phlebotomi]TYR35979.1 hypothetical protein FXV77_11090 [Sphingobacterium phlebotomi]
MSTVNSALEEIMQLDYTSREMILEILKKRQIEARREDIAKNARKSIRDYQRGKTPAKSLSETLDHLENL